MRFSYTNSRGACFPNSLQQDQHKSTSDEVSVVAKSLKEASLWPEHVLPRSVLKSYICVSKHVL